MITIVKNRNALLKLMDLPYHKIMQRFDEAGKIDFLRIAYGRCNDGEKGNLADRENEYCDTLVETVGPEGIKAMLAVVEGGRTYSWKRGHSAIHIIEETDRILNDENYRKAVDTELGRNRIWFEELTSQLKAREIN